MSVCLLFRLNAGRTRALTQRTVTLEPDGRGALYCSSIKDSIALGVTGLSSGGGGGVCARAMLTLCGARCRPRLCEQRDVALDRVGVAGDKLCGARAPVPLGAQRNLTRPRR